MALSGWSLGFGEGGVGFKESFGFLGNVGAGVFRGLRVDGPKPQHNSEKDLGVRGNPVGPGG